MTSVRNISRRTVLVVLAGAVVLVAALIFGISIGRVSLLKSAYGANYAQRPYTATIPQFNVSSTKEFTFTLNKAIDFATTTVAGTPRPKDNTALGDVAQVFSDPALQHQVPAWICQAKNRANQVIVAPAPEGIYADSHTSNAAVKAGESQPAVKAGESQPAVELASPGEWDGFSRYYLARYIGANGKKLARPVVTMFTVRGAGFALKAPAAVHTSVNASGILQISWTPVKGASDYQLVVEAQVTDPPPESAVSSPGDADANAQSPDSPEQKLYFSVIDRKGGTSLNLTDTSMLNGVYYISEDEVAQNRKSVEEDGGANLYGLDVRQFSTSDNGRLSLAVVATSAGKRSPLEFRPLTPALLNQIPLEDAQYAQQLANEVAHAHKTSAAAGLMTMADGSTINLNGKDGKPERYIYPKSSIDWNTYKEPKPKTTMAQVPYPVNGSTELVKFLASNLMADNYYLDVTAYLGGGSDGTTKLDDALEEAQAQNPYILYDNLYAELTTRDGRQVTYISSFYLIKDHVALRRQLWEKVCAVDSQIISSTMSNEAKAQAINAWLIRHGSYDRDAFNASVRYQKNGAWDIDVATVYYNRFSYAQNATGILLRGKGVCASYAAAFKALADRAALPCLYVTGTVNTTKESHAWNKVNLGGRWLIVDSAWNDEGGISDRYFGLTDNSKRADRKQDKSFMTDAYISRYAN